MEPKTKTLRDYQEKLVFNVCRATEDVLVEQPTGSGKTVQIVTLVAMHLGKRFSHAVIAAPQEQIEQGFVKRDYRVVAFPERAGVAVPSIQVPKQTILGARDSKVGSVKRVLQYLRQPGPLDHAFACTHAALNRLTVDDLPTDLTGKALFIDEAHHASADGLSQIVTLWHERGGQLFFFTATPYRGDGRPVKLDGMRTYRRSLAEHMAEGFAPRHLESEIVALGQPGDLVTAAQFTGEEAPPPSYFDLLVAAICRRWCDDAKPKAIVRVPPMQGGKSGELVRRLTQALTAQNARVLDATGTGVADKQRFLSGLKAEQQQSFASSTFDVMIGIQRVLEGTDWPLCSAAYCIGMPGSLNTVVQFLGRAMRLKGPDYPAEQRDRAKLVFFVPCGGGSALADLSIDHSRHALLTCCFLADHEVGQEWIVTQEVRCGIEAALGHHSPHGRGVESEGNAAADAENDANEPLDPQIRAEVELAMADARAQLIQSGNEPTVGAVVERTAQTRPDLPAATIQRVATEILAAADNPAGRAARQAIGREIATRLRIDPKVKQAMTEAFAVVLEEFRDATLKDSAVLESVGRQVHGVTGGQMREFAQRLRDAAPRPLTADQILDWVDAHKAATGDWPKKDSGQVTGTDETWARIHDALLAGNRGLPGGSSLARLLAEHRGVRNQQDLPSLTFEQILAWADTHKAATGEWPEQKSGHVAGTDETWSRISAALDRGLRGLPGGSSLAKLLAEHRGKPNKQDLPPLNIEQILAWADMHVAASGVWPNIKSGQVAGTEETWLGINSALSQGNRGLPSGSTLATLLAEHGRKRNRKNLSDLTIEQILAWADAHRSATGEWPGQKSGEVVGADETWLGIDAALQRGRRGMPDGYSLAKLLAEYRGIRHRMDIPRLTVDQIIEWARMHRRTTGVWPNRESGQVPETDELWSRIDDALFKGLRGLPSGSSLAKVLAKQCGKRNPKDLDLLTNEQILAWAEAHKAETGDWPTRKSGQVKDTDENWSAIDASLQQGRRGLPKGSSLPKLLAEYGGKRNLKGLEPLTVQQILAWADIHKAETGNWPNQKAGTVVGTDETWSGINASLQQGRRGLPGGTSLPRLLADQRGVRHRLDSPPLTTEQILGWLDTHRRATGVWPNKKSGQVTGTDEVWSSIDDALFKGRRGLPGGSSLARLIKEHRGDP